MTVDIRAHVFVDERHHRVWRVSAVMLVAADGELAIALPVAAWREVGRRPPRRLGAVIVAWWAVIPVDDNGAECDRP